MKPLFIPKEIVEKLNEAHEKYTRSKLGLVEKPIVGSKDWLAQQMNQKNDEIALLRDKVAELEKQYEDLTDDYVTFRCINGNDKELRLKLKSIQELCVNSRGEIHYYVDDFIESIEEILEK